jgi:hypothetical protein
MLSICYVPDGQVILMQHHLPPGVLTVKVTGLPQPFEWLMVGC